MIIAVDALMGKGKTNYIISHMNSVHEKWVVSQFSEHPLPKTQFLVVVPFLKEVDRIREACPNLDFVDPCPQMGSGRKLTHLERLVENGENICTTHALFKKLNQNIYGLLKENNYVLVLDETLDAVNIYESLGNHDKNVLFDQHSVLLEAPTGRLRWNEAEYPDYHGRFGDVKNLCDNGNLVFFRGTVWLWKFPVEFFQCFRRSYILTYMFDSAPMAAYLRGAGLSYHVMSVHQNSLVDRTPLEYALEERKRLKGLVSIYEGDMNNIGDPVGNEQPLSSTWFKRETGKLKKNGSPALKRLKSSTENFFKRFAPTKREARAWTTFKPARSHVKGAGYAREFIPFNTKATNEYRHKDAVAYLCNVFMHPFLKGYLESQGTIVDEEAYALSELLQWLWRTQIRDGKPIKVFIPSKRMRQLLKDWLDGVDLIKLSQDAPLRP